MIIGSSGSHYEILRGGNPSPRPELAPRALPSPSGADEQDANPAERASRFPALTSPEAAERAVSVYADRTSGPVYDGLGSAARRALNAYQSAEQAGARDELAALIGIDVYA